MMYPVVIGAVNQLISEHGYSLTLRQIFYRLVSSYGLPNSKSSYAGLSKQLVKARMLDTRDQIQDMVDDLLRKLGEG